MSKETRTVNIMNKEHEQLVKWTKRRTVNAMNKGTRTVNLKNEEQEQLI